MGGPAGGQGGGLGLDSVHIHPPRLRPAHGRTGAGGRTGPPPCRSPTLRPALTSTPAPCQASVMIQMAVTIPSPAAKVVKAFRISALLSGCLALVLAPGALLAAPALAVG